MNRIYRGDQKNVTKTCHEEKIAPPDRNLDLVFVPQKSEEGDSSVSR